MHQQEAAPRSFLYSTKISSIAFTMLLSLSFSACSSEQKVSGDPTKGTLGTQPDGSENNKSNNNATAEVSKESKAPDKLQDSETQKPAVKLTDSEIIGKMVWAPLLTNVESGKLFTGFGGGANFQFTMALAVVANATIPEEIAKTLAEPDFARIFTSTEFKQKAYALRAKLSVTSDPTYFRSEELPADQIDPEDPMTPLRVYFVTTLRAGTSNIDVTLDGKKLTLPVTIAAYTAQQLNDGRARYTAAVAGATPSPSCQSCHGVQGGANHSPTFLAQFADASILATIETGKNPEDGFMTKIAHNMTFATPAQRAGIVAYLRSLPPMPNSN